MLPQQQTNIAKYYHEDHFALTCASASNNVEVLKNELSSPSIFFKQYAATEYVRLQARYPFFFLFSSFLVSVINQINNSLLQR